VATRRGFGVAGGHVFIVGLPLLWLEVRILVVCRVEVRTVSVLAWSSSILGTTQQNLLLERRRLQWHLRYGLSVPIRRAIEDGRSERIAHLALNVRVRLDSTFNMWHGTSGADGKLGGHLRRRKHMADLCTRGVSSLDGRLL
jgi:hypothetical protein